MGLLMRMLGRIELGSLLVVHGDCEWLLKGSKAGPEATLRVHSPMRLLRRVLLRGDIGFAESYMRGDWESPNLAALLLLLVQNEQALAAQSRASALVSWLNRLRHRMNRNSLRGSRRNIAAHYDLGNSFYRLWLDPSMTYSSALFDNGETDLEQAQRRKYERLLDMLGAQPGQRILEIGCGWGGLAVEAAKRGLFVTGITLSREQLAFARQRAREAGVDGSVELRLQDYRQLSETYDHIVSIEMLEAVGEENWDSYTSTLRRCLEPGGRAALQFITIEESAFEGYRRNPDFIQRYIFPGGMLPTLTRFRAAVEASGLRTVRADLFGGDYASTLLEWHRRFLQSEPEVERMGFDERFRRMWKYYLAYCEAGFRSGRIELAQVLLANE
jgi:cyclopropane-fatty-acyl-phospholipid synthase